MAGMNLQRERERERQRQWEEAREEFVLSPLQYRHEEAPEEMQGRGLTWRVDMNGETVWATEEEIDQWRMNSTDHYYMQKPTFEKVSYAERHSGMWNRASRKEYNDRLKKYKKEKKVAEKAQARTDERSAAFLDYLKLRRAAETGERIPDDPAAMERVVRDKERMKNTLKEQLAISRAIGRYVKATDSLRDGHEVRVKPGGVVSRKKEVDPVTAVAAYAGDYYAYMNSQARYGDRVQMSPKNRARAKLLNENVAEACKMGRLTHDVVTKRRIELGGVRALFGFDLPVERPFMPDVPHELERVLGSYAQNAQDKVLRDKAFVSTSYLKDYFPRENPVEMVVNLKKGTPAFNIASNKDVQVYNETELLIGANVPMKILKVERCRQRSGKDPLWRIYVTTTPAEAPGVPRT